MGGNTTFWRVTVTDRDVALKLVDRALAPKQERKAEHMITLGAGTKVQKGGFLQGLRDREVEQQVSEFVRCNPGKNILTAAVGA